MPVTRQKSTGKRSAFLHRDSISRDHLRRFCSSKRETEDDIKLITESPDYHKDAAIVTEFVRDVSPPRLNTSFVSARGEETPPLLNDSREIDIYVTRLMDAVDKALARSPEPASLSPPTTPPPPPPCFRVSAPTPTSPSLAREIPLPHVPRKSTRIRDMRASAGIEKARLPLKTRDVNTPRFSGRAVGPLRGAGGSIFISRMGYKRASVAPKALAELVK